jgi:hypothetical protein
MRIASRVHTQCTRTLHTHARHNARAQHSTSLSLQELSQSVSTHRYAQGTTHAHSTVTSLSLQELRQSVSTHRYAQGTTHAHSTVTSLSLQELRQSVSTHRYAHS